MVQGYFIMAGPQAAGKSSSIRYIHARYQADCSLPEICDHAMLNIVLVREMRKILVNEHNVLGAIFMDISQDIEITKKDLARLDEIIGREDDRVYMDETNIFTLAHIMTRGHITNSYYEEYIQRLEQLKAAVMFLDLPPDISWQRRKARYEERVSDFPPLQRAVILERYREYLIKVHGPLHEIYDSLPLDKVMINTEGNLDDTQAKVAEAFEELALGRGIKLFTRF
jgi:thymidylate kinase